MDGIFENYVRDYTDLNEAVGVDLAFKQLSIFWKVRKLHPEFHELFCERVGLKPFERELLRHFAARLDYVLMILNQNRSPGFGYLCIMLSSRSEFETVLELAKRCRNAKASTIMGGIFKEYASAIDATKSGAPEQEMFGVKLKNISPPAELTEFIVSGAHANYFHGWKPL
jgi:hypothetical protein